MAKHGSTSKRIEPAPPTIGDVETPDQRPSPEAAVVDRPSPEAASPAEIDVAAPDLVPSPEPASAAANADPGDEVFPPVLRTEIILSLPMAATVDPTAYLASYCHVDVHLTVQEAELMRFLKNGLDRENIRLRNGRHIISRGDVFRWLLETIADEVGKEGVRRQGSGDRNQESGASDGR